MPVASSTAPINGPLYLPLISHDTVETPQFQPVDIAGVAYQLYTSASPDRNRPLQKIYRQRTNSIDSTGADIRVTSIDTARGFDVIYRFRLRDAAGKPVFSQTLRKTKELAAAMGEDFVIDTDPFRPQYLGYLPAFGSLAFLVGFGPDGSDVGGDLLVLLDAKTGRLRHAGVNQWFLGASNGGQPLLSADGQALLTSYELLRADGRIINFKRPNTSVGATTWLSNHAMLVAYAPDTDSLGHDLPMRQPNNVVQDREGKVLAQFSLNAIDNYGLGYDLHHYYLPATRTHYFFDDEGKKLGLISRAAPSKPQIVPLRSLRRFNSPQRPGEVRFQMKTELGAKLTLLADTVSGALRYYLSEPKERPELP
ncbi:hypothetical protein F0P96_15980 [Hymenobacter busanensis]|uniref:Uncharacterized protein n=1 Tax=Hymenobacter busanensis TaxID=2607656 RepID=A0A7L4ZVF2_9BACT|nr:hypothetical protein [Hymenobacter busanensis]KAA9327480.1 hypothetical protein F0P96_15980 [Hymenobacter busanensis]QHJ06182.1 hypothetical protein GUY19_02255 [Hymenobacter busanensis]